MDAYSTCEVCPHHRRYHYSIIDYQPDTGESPLEEI